MPRKISVEINRNGKSEIVNEDVYSWDELPLVPYIDEIPVKKNQKLYYYNIPCAFDIETTNVKKGKFSFMYHWQFAIGPYVCFGRRWEEFQELFKRLNTFFNLSSGIRLVIYVHNLSFEFQFLRSFIPIDSAFLTNKRHLLKFTSGGIEFRCSYKLSNMSLAKWGENTPNVLHYKLIDTYNYNLIRTAETPLTTTELSYCYNDVRGMTECLAEHLKNDTIATIPLTSTGYIRREYRTAMQKNRKNRENFLYSRLYEKEYTMLRTAFRGGDTHANRLYVGDTIYDVHSMDISSSYPGAMMCEEFPISKFYPVKEAEKVLELEGNAWFARLLIVKPNYIGTCGNPYISLSKCTRIKNYINDNGRILQADFLEIYVTDIDYEIIMHEYDYKRIYLRDAYTARYGKLPIEFRNHLLDLFKDKTALKDIDEKIYEYNKQKNKVNGSYGMMVTDIAKANYEYIEGEFKEEKEISIDEKLNKYYKSRNSFLSYQHGVWTTAHARYKLRKMLWKIGEDNVYDDTDGLKFIGDENIEKFEEENKLLIEIAKENNAYAYDKDGKIHYMGVWEYEGVYKEFRTLGAKKYIYNKYNKKKNQYEIHSVLSGVNVEKGANFFNEHGIDSFEIGCKITNSGHLSSTYNDVGPHYITVTDYLGHECTMLSGSNVYMEETPYIIGVTKEYAEILGIAPELMEYLKKVKKAKIIDESEADSEEI